MALRQTKVTPSTLRSRPFTLHGVPARFAGAAAPRSPTTSQANDAAVAERNARRDAYPFMASYTIAVQTQKFTKLFEVTNVQITNYVSRRISWDVDDVVDEIYTTAWRRRADMPSNPDEVILWLYAVGRKVIANKLRWKSRLDRFSKLNNPLVASENSNRSPSENWVHEALAILPANQREVLMMVEWDSLSVADAAKVIGVPETTITKRLHSARAAFAGSYSLIEAREK